MDDWCPSCGYSVERDERFCGGCGQELTAQVGVSAASSPGVTMKSPAAPPPPAGSRMPGPPPPPPMPPGPHYGHQGAPGQVPDQPTLALPAPVAPVAPAPETRQPGAQPLSDTLERMLRPQGLFQNPQQALSFDWQQPYSPPPAPSAYAPQSGQHQSGQHQSGQHQSGGQYPPGPGGPYLAAPTSVQSPAPPTGWAPAAPPGPPQPGYPEPGPPAGGRYPYGGALSGPWGNGPQPNGPYQNGQPGPGPFSPGEFGPSAQYPPDGPPPGPGTRTRRLPRGPLVPIAAVGGVAVVVVAALLLSSQNGPSSNTANPGAGTGGTPSSSASSSATGTSSAAAREQRQAATQLSGLLPQSGTDHAAVNAAVTNVQNCGKHLSKDVRIFRQSAASRRTLLAKLGQLSGRQTLPAKMADDLTQAWQSSATVDDDLARWAADQVGHCHKGNTKDHNYQVTYPYDNKSTSAKEAFVSLWNPLARRDGLPTYQWSQL